MKVKIINRSKNPLPEYKTEGAAGVDLRSANEQPILLKPLERTLVPTGLFLEIPMGYEGQVRARSGLSIKNGITLINAVGTIDSDYRGELKIPVVNLSNEDFTINYGERIAQLIFAAHAKAQFIETEEIQETKRGDGGFGSTGI